MTVELNTSFSNHPSIISSTLLNNRYLVQKILGQGGLGRTYLALDSYRFNEPCVLKEFAPLVTKDYLVKKSRALFEREAKILYQLEHPQIPQFFACFETQGRLFLVQEYIHGKSYCQLLQKRLKIGLTFSETEIIQLLLDLLPTLDYIHKRGIIHRDISPDNIMQPHDHNLPMLIDFGVGKQWSEQEKNINSFNPTTISSVSVSVESKHTLVGKIGYSPSEQINLGRCFPCSDLYALGVTAIVLLTGKQPTQLMDYSSLEWQWRSYTQVSEPFRQILDRLIIAHPKYRYQSAKELLSSLEQLRPKVRNNTSPSSFVSHQPKQFYQEDNQIQETSVTQPYKLSNAESEPNYFLNPNFIKHCQTELAYCIGPMATLLVNEILDNYPFLSPQQLVEAIIAAIPDERQSLAFEQRFGLFIEDY
jgi:serine/threonine-protein kinase